ncbi:hypothetical protein OG225_23355 [Nocardia sp. NBC_01377]|uniref:hypothetical protein n=1 Tax=Nocardia sp. NBC_01377 TaxID=2903595 RepID=UPI00324A1EF3
MRTAISDPTANTTVPAPIDDVVDGPDQVFDSFPSPMRHRRRGGARELEAVSRTSSDRRPRGSRPGGAVELYRRGSARMAPTSAPHAVYPMEARVARAELGFATLAIAALLSALVVIALIGLAHWRAGTFQGETPASTPGVVEPQTATWDLPPR